MLSLTPAKARYSDDSERYPLPRLERDAVGKLTRVALGGNSLAVEGKGGLPFGGEYSRMHAAVREGG
jgi:hypothetical protein